MAEVLSELSDWIFYVHDIFELGVDKLNQVRTLCTACTWQLSLSLFTTVFMLRALLWVRGLVLLVDKVRPSESAIPFLDVTFVERLHAPRRC